MEEKIEFQAYGKEGCTYGDIPSEAAVRYFEEFPKSRKCDVTEGIREGYFFTIVFDQTLQKKYPKFCRDVTKKQAATLGVEDGN